MGSGPFLAGAQDQRGGRWTLRRGAEFEQLIRSYLGVVLESPAPHRGWKIPETTLVYPWILRMFPDVKYIFWIRDPRDCVIGGGTSNPCGGAGAPGGLPGFPRGGSG